MSKRRASSRPAETTADSHRVQACNLDRFRGLPDAPGPTATSIVRGRAPNAIRNGTAQQRLDPDGIPEIPSAR